MDEQESMKSMYVLNLDNQRIIIVLGVVLMLCAGSFMLGMKYHSSIDKANAEGLALEDILKKEQVATPQIEAKPKALTEDEVISREISKFKEQDLITSLPETTTAVIRTQDRFISGPPKKRGTHKKLIVRRQRPANVVYTIQIAAFARQQDARKLLGELKAKGISARIDRGKRFFFVRSGKASRKASLQRRLSTIRSKSGLQAIVVRKQLS